jgi:hypothetical protein
MGALLRYPYEVRSADEVAATIQTARVRQRSRLGRRPARRPAPGKHRLRRRISAISRTSMSPKIRQDSLKAQDTSELFYSCADFLFGSEVTKAIADVRSAEGLEPSAQLSLGPCTAGPDGCS